MSLWIRWAPCALLAAAVIAVGCSADDGSGGSDDAQTSQPSGTSEDPDAPSVRIATLNVLHGNPIAVPDCAQDDQCGAPDRVELLMRHIAESRCPEIVTLQEVDTRIEQLIDSALPALCDGTYSSSLLADPDVSLGIDREMVLTSLPIESDTLLDLPAVPWSAHHARISSPIGPIDLVTTHLASGSNNPACVDTDCPAICAPQDDARLCGARQILRHLDAAGGDALHVITGDLNARPGEPTHRLFVDAGYADAYAEAGNPECSRNDRSGCTSGRSELELTDPGATTDSRIDYVLVRSSPGCTVGFGAHDVSGWADRPAEPVGPSGIVFVSDHSGVIATVACA